MCTKLFECGVIYSDEATVIMLCLGVSIIITTHYVEEARDAHMVGIMRNGRLLAQEPPGLLMERHQAQTLEKVFLRLCIETE